MKEKQYVCNMIFGYIRVSSDKQTVENQRFLINQFCEKNKMVVNNWIEETISGSKDYNERELGQRGGSAGCWSASGRAT